MEELYGCVVTLCEQREKVNATEPSNSERIAGFGTPAPPWGHVGHDLPDQSDTVKPDEDVSPEPPTETQRHTLGSHVVLSPKLL